MSGEDQSPAPPQGTAGSVPYKYWAFISYNSGDAEIAVRLHRKLETYRLPNEVAGSKSTTWGRLPARLMPVFRDRDELPGAHDLTEKVREALRNSRTLIVVCSPRAVGSDWVNREILYFKSLGRETRILPFIVDGKPNANKLPGREAEECFPHALRHRAGPDGTLTNEAAQPVGGDARKTGDGFHRAMLKTVAGMLEIDFDRLVRRDEERRTRETSLWIGGLVMVAAVLAGLALWALQERAEARRQTVIAEKQAEVAREEEKKTAVALEREAVARKEAVKLADSRDKALKSNFLLQDSYNFVFGLVTKVAPRNQASSGPQVRIELHVFSAAQCERASLLAYLLRSSGYRVPDIEVAGGSGTTAVRYFRAEPGERERAEEITQLLNQLLDINTAKTEFSRGYEGKKPGLVYEVWFGTNTLLPAEPGPEPPLRTSGSHTYCAGKPAK